MGKGKKNKKGEKKGGPKERRERIPNKRKQQRGKEEGAKKLKAQRKEVHDIKIAQLNAGRLTSTKHTFLEEAANKHQIDVLCLQEVKRRTDPGDRDIKIDGFRWAP